MLKSLCRKILGRGTSAPGCIDARRTVRAAAQRGLTVCEYVESLWNQTGATDSIIEQMEQAGALTGCTRVCEIGPGTGRYLERTAARVSPQIYDFYETAEDWAAWLAARYAPLAARRPADGRTLSATPTGSCGLVHVHGVFTYLPLVQCFEYFGEMVRVCAPAGFLVFDFHSDVNTDLSAVQRWILKAERHWVVLPRLLVLEYFYLHHFELIREFDLQAAENRPHYLVLRNRS